jgi:hypothetical protein
MSDTHHVTYTGPRTYSADLQVVLHDEGVVLDGFTSRLASHAGKDASEVRVVTITVTGAFAAVERACRRFARLWPTTQLELNGQRVIPETDLFG